MMRSENGITKDSKSNLPACGLKGGVETPQRRLESGIISKRRLDMRNNLMFLLVFLFLLNGCGVWMTSARSEGKLKNLEIGMRPSDVDQVIGEPDATRVNQRTRNGEVVKIDEFRLY